MHAKINYLIKCNNRNQNNRKSLKFIQIPMHEKAIKNGIFPLHKYHYS